MSLVVVAQGALKLIQFQMRLRPPQVGLTVLVVELNRSVAVAHCFVIVFLVVIGQGTVGEEDRPELPVVRVYGDGLAVALDGLRVVLLLYCVVPELL